MAAKERFERIWHQWRNLFLLLLNFDYLNINQDIDFRLQRKFHIVRLLSLAVVIHSIVCLLCCLRKFRHIMALRYHSLWHYSNHCDILAALKQNSYLQKLGQNIREVRKSMALSQEQLALQARIDRSYIGGIERGERNVSFLTLVKIAEQLNCDVSRLTKDIINERDQ